MEKIQLGAGCFWGVQQLLDQLDGVMETVVGYSGGQTANPDYRAVCTGTTGHAETVLVTYDETKLSTKELIDYFWRLHNPTTLNRQGVDVGHQYRSGIYYYNEAQRVAALESKAELAAKQVYDEPIVTEILAAKEFFAAEEYHQKYFEKNPGEGCHFLRPE